MQDKREELEMKKQAILSQIMTPEARERLSRIGIVKPEKAQHIQAMLIQQAQRGQIGGKVTEAMLKNILEGLSAGEKAKKNEDNFSTKKYAGDSDSEDYLK